jgi:hypothetical protein
LVSSMPPSKYYFFFPFHGLLFPYFSTSSSLLLFTNFFSSLPSFPPLPLSSRPSQHHLLPPSPYILLNFLYSSYIFISCPVVRHSSPTFLLSSTTFSSPSYFLLHLPGFLSMNTAAAFSHSAILCGLHKSLLVCLLTLCAVALNYGLSDLQNFSSYLAFKQIPVSNQTHKAGHSRYKML